MDYIELITKLFEILLEKFSDKTEIFMIIAIAMVVTVVLVKNANQLINRLRRWCLHRWDLGRGLPFCHSFRLSGDKVEKAFVEALEVERKGVCDPLGDTVCGFFIALLATTAKALGNGYGVEEYLRERYGEYCTKGYSKEELPSLYVMCKALGVGKVRKMKKQLERVVKEFKRTRRGDYDRKRVELALGFKNYYDIPEALCVPFAKVSGRVTETSKVVKACRKLKVAIEETVDPTNRNSHIQRVKHDKRVKSPLRKVVKSGFRLNRD